MSPRSRYRALNVALGLTSLLLLAAPRALTLTPAGDGLLLPGGARVPELCLRKRLTGEPARSCQLGRSVVLAAHGEMEPSLARHPGGLLLWGWVAAHAAVRLGLALAAVPGRRWWIDLTFTAASLLAVSSAVALFEGAPAPPGA